MKKIIGPIPSVANVIAQACIVGEYVDVKRTDFVASRYKIVRGLTDLNFRKRNAELAVDDALGSGMMYKKKGRIHLVFAKS